jgi:transcriptional regulator with XRE-family HTH domain
MTRSEYLLDLRTRIANNVRFYRHSRGWTQGQMADELGVAENSIYLLENPKSRYNVPITTLASVTHALGLPLGAVLVAREEQPNKRGKPGSSFLSHKRNEANHES